MCLVYVWLVMFQRQISNNVEMFIAKKYMFVIRNY